VQPPLKYARERVLAIKEWELDHFTVIVYTQGAQYIQIRERHGAPYLVALLVRAQLVPLATALGPA
jgi:hypothetical protein